MDSLALSINILLVDPIKDDREYWAERLASYSPPFTIFEAETGVAAVLFASRSDRLRCA
jgi:hypothetical protein